MTSIGPLTPNPYQQIDRPQDLVRPERPERPGGDENGRPNVERFRNHLQNQAKRLRNAVESGDVDPARARKVRDNIIDKRDRAHDRISDRPDRPIDRPRPDDDGSIDPAKIRERLQNLKERLKNAVNEGDLSPERARKIYQKHLDRAKEALGIGDDDGSISPLRVRKHLQHLKGRLQNAVGNGDLSPEQAREIWNQHVERAKKLLGQGNGNGNGGGNNGGVETPDFETIANAKRGNTLTLVA